MATLETKSPQKQQEAFGANLTGANLDATLASRNKGSLSESLMSPEEMKQLRDEAKLAISRGATALSDMGQVGGLQAPDWQTLQHMLGSQQYQIGDIKSNPVVNLNGMADAANAKTLQNRAMGLAQTDKVNPLTAALEKQGEDTYNTATLNQTLWKPELIPQQTAAMGSVAGTMANSARELADQALRSGVNGPTNVSLSTPGGQFGAKVASAYQPTPDANKLPPEVKDYGHQFNSMFDQNRNTENLTKNAVENRAYLDKVTNDYAASDSRNPKNINDLYNNFKTGAGSLVNDGIITKLNTAAQASGIPADQLGQSVANGSWFTTLGKNLGVGSEAEYLWSKAKPLIQQLPERDQLRIAEQMTGGTIDKNGLMTALQTAVNNSTGEYYKKNALSVMTQDNPYVTSGQVPVRNIQNKLNDSYALNAPSVVIASSPVLDTDGKPVKNADGTPKMNNLTAADAVLKQFRANAAQAEKEGWSPERKTAEDLKDLQEIDALTKSYAAKQSKKAPEAPARSPNVIAPPRMIVNSNLMNRE